MDHIGSLFSRLKKAFSELDDSKEVVVKVCNELVGLDLKKDNVEFVNGIIKLDISPSARSNLYMRKGRILSRLNQELKKPVKDIR